MLADRPHALTSAGRHSPTPRAAVERGDEPALSAARAAVWTTILRASLVEATRAAAAGDVERAHSWLLVREFRPPTRFSRAAADATVALDELAAGTVTARTAARAVRRDLLDTYDSRLRTALAGLRDADEQGFAATRAEMGALALGYWRIVAPVYRSAQGARAGRALNASFEQLAAAAGSRARIESLLARVEREHRGLSRRSPRRP